MIRVGNLEAERDFTDVRDMVRAYQLGAESCPSGRPYNIASGRARSIQEVLDILLSLTEADIDVRPEEKRMREAEVPVFVGDHGLFSRTTGWEPEYTLEESLKTVLDYWRRRVRE